MKRLLFFLAASLLLVGRAQAQQTGTLPAVADSAAFTLQASTLAQAQQPGPAPAVLTVQDAIYLAVANNQNLKIQALMVQSAQNSATKGNAGLLPTVALTGSANYQNNTADIGIRTFAENPPRVDLNEDGVASTTMQFMLQANYVLVGGYAGRYRYQILQAQNTQAYYQQQVALNQVALGVAELFMDIANLQQQEALLLENVDISQKRLDRISNRQAFGQATGMERLSAQTEINSNLNALDQVRLSKSNLLQELNFLMGVPPTWQYQVQVNYQPPPVPSAQQVQSRLLAQNPGLQVARQNALLAQKQENLSRAVRYPQISATAGYGYFQQENDLQQLARIETLGYTVGLNLRYNIFTGGQNSTRVQNARLASQISQHQQQYQQDALVKEALKEHSRLVLLLQQLQRAQQDLATFKSNFNRTEQRFFNGKATALDVRDAQRALLNAQVAISNAKIQIMKSALRLDQQQGRLLSQAQP